LVAGTRARAQLAVQRSGQLDWLRRLGGGAGGDEATDDVTDELWTLVPQTAGAASTTWSARRSHLAVPPNSWLAAEPDGGPKLVRAPVGEGDGASRSRAGGPSSGPSSDAVAAALWHPRTGAWFLGSAAALEERPSGRVHAIGVAAMTLSTDQRRLYLVSPGGELFMLPVMPLGLHEVPESDAPELVLGELDRHGEPRGLALGPAGLVLLTSRAVIGINLRSRTVAPILAELSAHPACAALRAQAVAMDHRRNLFLADEHAVVCAPGHGTPPYVCARP
jgi:hypothetical protein